VLYDHKVTIQDFFEIKVPQAFVDGINTVIAKREKVRCLSPWCPSYGKDHSIVKTGTTSKRYKNGTRLTGHVACLDCGSEFAFNTKGQLQVKDYFLDGYRFLQEANPQSIAEIQRLTGYSISICRRIAAYFQARDMFELRPVIVREHQLEGVVKAIGKSARISDVQVWPCWDDEYDFLVHRFHPMVMKALIQLKRPANDRLPRSEYFERLIQACNDYIEEDVTITVEGIAKTIGVTSNTIRKWGYFQYIAKMKEKQKQLRLDIRINEWYVMVDNYFAHNPGDKVLSKDIYVYLGVRHVNAGINLTH